jgi:hypothetical protein
MRIIMSPYSIKEMAKAKTKANATPITPENKEFRDKLTRQTQDTFEKAKKLQACQMQFCKKELEASQQLAMQIKDKTNGLIQQLATKKIDMKTYMKELDVIRRTILDASETRILGACQLDKCEIELKESMRATLASFDTMCSTEKKSSNACSIYKKGMELLDGKGKAKGKFDQDKLTELLKLISTYIRPNKKP